MQMIDMLVRQKSMEGSVDRSCDGVVAEGAQRIRLHHFVFECHAAVPVGEREKFVEIESGESFALNAADIAAAAFDP